MKVTLYMAISIDGFIAKVNDDTSWVSNIDWKNFSKYIKNQDAILMGRKTFEVSGTDFPYKGALNIVVTSNKKLLDKIPNDRELFLNKNPNELISYLKEKEYQKVGIIGGG